MRRPTTKPSCVAPYTLWALIFFSVKCFKLEQTAPSDPRFSDLLSLGRMMGGGVGEINTGKDGESTGPSPLAHVVLRGAETVRGKGHLEKG